MSVKKKPRLDTKTSGIVLYAGIALALVAAVVGAYVLGLV